MMYSEFYDRTKTEVSSEEYHFIEESYYDFNGDKNAFCKAWLKDKKSGKWDLEYRLRKALEDQKAEYQRKIEKMEETIEFYRPYFDRARDAEKKLAEQEEKINDVVERMNRCTTRWAQLLTS